MEEVNRTFYIKLEDEIRKKAKLFQSIILKGLRFLTLYGKMYLYDLINIKKETSTPLKQ